MPSLMKLVPPAKNAAQYSNTIIKVIVGDPEAAIPPKQYQLHAFQLVHRSQFFRCALSRGWKEGVEKTVSLPDDDPKLFDQYISLVFFGTVPIGNEIPKWWPRKKVGDLELAVYNRYRKLFELFVLCDKLQDWEAKNTIIDAVAEQSMMYYRLVPLAYDNDSSSSSADARETSSGDIYSYGPMAVFLVLPRAKDINFIYNNTAGPCGMRRLLTNMRTVNIETLDKWVEVGEEDFSKTFLYDVIKHIGKSINYVSYGPTLGPWNAKSADYHEKERDEGEVKVG